MKKIIRMGLGLFKMKKDVVAKVCPECKCEFTRESTGGRYDRVYCCRSCKAKGSGRKYRQRNSEKINESSREYYRRNSEKINERIRKHNQENPEKIKERAKRYYHENSEKIREKNRKYHKENPEKMKELKRRNNIKRKIEAEQAKLTSLLMDFKEEQNRKNENGKS